MNKNWKKQAHISSFYAEYFIPDCIYRKIFILYLDCDLIINDKLDSLFDPGYREERYIAAIKCKWPGFNTGVLLINNKNGVRETKERLIERSILTTKEVEEGVLSI